MSSRVAVCRDVLCTYAGMGFTVLTTARVLCVRSQDLVLSVSVRRAHAVFLIAGFKGGVKPSPKTRETVALRRGI